MIPIKKYISFFFIFASLVLAALAQETAPTGSITGRVYNPATGEYVRNAQIRVLSTNESTRSGDGGFYRLGSVPAGQVTVEVSYIGYPTVSDAVVVNAGATTARDFSISEAESITAQEGDVPIHLEAFVVSTEREGSAKAIMDERASMNITSHIASEVFGDNAEGNVGEFLRNVPGVTLDTDGGEVRNVGLGGLGSEYTNVTVDGMSLAGADANNAGSRSVTFEQVSLSSIDSVEVARTISADVDANAAGGTINLRSKHAFDRQGRRIVWQTNVGMHSTALNLDKSYGPFEDRKTLKARPGGIFEYSDVFMDNRLGVVLNVSESNLYQSVNRVVVDYNRTTTAADQRPQVPSRLAFQQQSRFNKRFATTLTTDYRATDNLVLSLSAIYNNSVLWNPQRAVYFYQGTRSTVIGDAPEFSYTTNSSTARVGLNPVNISKLGETLTLTPKFEYSRNDFTLEGALSYSDSTSRYETQARQGTMRSVGAPTASNVNFTASRSPGETATDWKVTQISGPDISDGASFSMPAIAINDDRFARGRFLTGQLTGSLITRRYLPITWKAGIKSREETRSFENRLGLNNYRYTGSSDWSAFQSPWGYNLGLGENIESLSGNNVFIPNLAALGELYQDHPEQFVEASSVTDYYNSVVANKRNFTERVDASFLMGTAKVGRASLRAGVRVENTSTDVLESDPRSADEVRDAGYTVSAAGMATTRDGIDYQFLSQPRVHRRAEYHNYFPSASFKYNITRELDFSMGFSSTIRRPSYSDVAGVWVVNENTNRVAAPNVNLKPEAARNYAARLAYYFKGVGQLSAAVYQNDVEDLIQSSELTAAEFGYTGTEYADYIFVTRANVGSLVTVRSLELGYSQSLGMFGPAFRRLTVRANYTRAYANAIKTGLIPHSVNAGVDYSYGPLNLYVNSNWTDSWPASATGLSFRRHRTQMDAGIGWKLNKHLSLMLSGRNVLNARYVQMQHVAPSAPTATDILDVGATYILSLKGTY
jgi:TonB-dependent receptor